MSQSLVSIVMPVYNSMEFVRSEGYELLPKALDSLLGQSYKNFELLILDNQSTDITPDICRAYAKKDSRIRYLLDVQKRFPEEAINHLASLMQGKFCMVANDDDLWHPDYIEKMVGFLERNPEIDMAYSNGNYIDVDGSSEGRIIGSQLDTYCNTVSNLSNYCAYIQRRNVIPIAFGVFKSETYRQVLPFEAFDELKADVDNLFMAKYFLLGHKCHYLDEELFFYRQKLRRLYPSKILGMPGLDKPLLIWMYYVRHQQYFFRKLDDLISHLDFPEMQYFYLKCVTFHSFIKHSLDLLNWIKRDNYIHTKNDKDACLKVLEFIAEALKPLLSDQEGVGLFQDDADNNVRFHPLVVARLLELTIKANTAFVEVVEYYNSLTGKNQESELVRDVEGSLHKEIPVFEKEKALVDSRLGKTPEILIQNNSEVYDHVEINNETPKLSIISCSLNLGRFLEETVLSVVRQSFKDYEHIVIDGGSTDETIEILKRYPHIKWISEKDSGYLEGFRKGLAMAKGKYVMQCAVSDGYIDTSWFQRCVNVLDSDSEVSLVWGFPQYLTEDSKLGDISYPQFHRVLPPQKNEYFAYWLRTGFWLPEGNFCVRKEVFEKCLPTSKEGPEVLEPYLEFNYFFNSFGYLPYHIPIVANFGRTHKNQLGQRESESGVGKRKLEMYLRKVEHYRWKVVTGTTIHVYRDGAHMPIPIKLPIEQIRRDYFNSIMPSHLLGAVKKSRLLSLVRALYSYYRHFRF